MVTRLVIPAVILAVLLGPTAVSAQDTKPLRVAIYYDVEDKAFERAAKTNLGDDDKSSKPLLLKVKTKKDFLDAWAAIVKAGTGKGALGVVSISIFTHASKQTDGQDGLEFANGDGGCTLTKDDIQKLPKIPWATKAGGTKLGRIDLFGCNTGLEGERGWSPAGVLAKSQGVVTTGQVGFSYFSKEPDVYKPIGDADMKVFLRAYKRGKNGLTGDGKYTEAKTYKP